MKLAHVTLVREDPATATILSKQYQETVPFYKITWSQHHVIFHTNELDEEDMVVYRADRVYEIVTEDLKQKKLKS
jgi:hypothetical protein